MHALLTTIGSAGDVHPFIAIGRALASRGHRVTLLANRHFESRTRAEGLGFAPLADDAEYRRVLHSPHLLDEVLGPRFVVEELVFPHVQRVLDEGRALVRADRPDVILAHHLCASAPWLGELYDIPVATASLAPLFWFSRHEPLAFGPLRTLRAPLWLSRLHLRIGRRAGRVLIDRPLNTARERLGLPQRSGFFFPGKHRGTIELGLWSAAFRGPLPDDPPHSRICGFARFDRRGDAGDELSPELRRFLDDGEPPLVFALGTTAVHGGGDFFRAAATACALLGRRGVLLTGVDSPAPGTLPRDVIAVPYAPYGALLPRGAATIHHGGIGTVAASLEAARPQVVVPFANDEFDNAARLERVGVGLTVRRWRANGQALASAISALVESPAVIARAQVLGRMIEREDGAAGAAAVLEQLADDRLRISA